MLFDLSGYGNWVRVWWWCVFYVSLGFLIFLVGDDLGR